MYRNIDTTIQVLLEKYAGGRIPPLVDLTDSRLGLIGNDLLRVYQSGFSSRYSTAMGILLPVPNLPAWKKWEKGSYEINNWNREAWSDLCKALRSKEEGNAICEACDRRQALLAENQKDVVAYMCDNGLIDFAVPILVKNHVVAILFCGQFKPEPASFWNPEIIQQNGYFRLLQPEEKGIEIHTESQRRINVVAQKLELQRLSQYYAQPINTADVLELQEAIRKSSKDLSELAASTYELEKAKIVDCIQNHITQALSVLSIKSTDSPETEAMSLSKTWQRLALELSLPIKYFGVDYLMILSLQDDIDKSIRLLCQSGLPAESFPAGTKYQLDNTEYNTAASIFSPTENLINLCLPDYKSLPVLDHLYHLDKRGRAKYSLSITTLAPRASASLIVIIGRLKKVTRLEEFSDDEMTSLNQIMESLFLVSELILLVEQLEETAKRQARFLEDVAHDIRTPIQNLIVQSEALNLNVNIEMAKQIGQEMAKQARRLNRMNSKIWTMVNIDRGVLHAEKPEPVHIYLTLTETRKFLLEMAEKREIRISIDKALESWSAVYMHKTLFLQAVLNLMDNAIKYSRDGTEVRIDGRYLPDGVSLNFVNRGIPIQESEREKIFDRYYRTPEAQSHTGAGTGIGLYIVKWFVDHAKGRIMVKSDPVPGNKKDYITVIELFIPHYVWR